MEANPYEPPDGVAEPDSLQVPMSRLVSVAVVMTMLSAFGLVVPLLGVLYWVAVLAGIPLLSSMASRGRKETGEKAPGCGCAGLVAIGSIIALYPICTAVSGAAGYALHKPPVDPFTNILIYSGSLGLAYCVVILVHCLRPELDDEPAEEQPSN